MELSWVRESLAAGKKPCLLGLLMLGGGCLDGSSLLG